MMLSQVLGTDNLPGSEWTWKCWKRRANFGMSEKTWKSLGNHFHVSIWYSIFMKIGRKEFYCFLDNAEKT